MSVVMQRENIKSLVESNEFFQRKLFFKGFLITNDSSIDSTNYPFCGNWEKHILYNGIYVISHHEESISIVKLADGNVACLIGHAYNPISGVYDEEIILKNILCLENVDAVFDYINELTGVFCLFISNSRGLKIINDPVGLQSVFYTTGEETFYVASHSNLIGDLFGLEVSSYVSKMINSPTFHYFGNQLPGNITQFSNVFRLIQIIFWHAMTSAVKSVFIIQSFWMFHMTKYAIHSLC